MDTITTILIFAGAILLAALPLLRPRDQRPGPSGGIAVGPCEDANAERALPEVRVRGR